MDAKSRNSMWEMMKQICNDFETTIFLTTHYLEEAESLSNNLCIIKDGKAVKHGRPAELRSLLRENIIRLQFVTEDEAKEHIRLLKNLLPQEEMLIRNSAVIIHSHDAQSDMERVISFLAEHHIQFQGIESTQPTFLVVVDVLRNNQLLNLSFLLSRQLTIVFGHRQFPPWCRQ